jgi:hypothetical protein
MLLISEKKNDHHSVAYVSLEQDSKEVLNGLLIDSSEIIDDIIANRLEGYLPPVLRRSDWHLYYSRYTHGKSWETLLRNCYGRGDCVMIIKDHGGNVFGGYISAGLQYREHFFGDGGSF